ncbi:DUF7619 domain-containing protein [Chryseobacterium indologenes]|uniref:DUF7619 domain-containing protein n=1 Tax=Chryseobacterium indologenes TaxID=253 RepID=UPI001628C3E9|nr:T9SS type A sorting domain-containing protein [Chryseobacterium indologenes]
MRKAWAVIFMIMFSIFKAQIISFSDPHLKSRLLAANTTNSIAANQDGDYIKIDSNNDGQIQYSEVVAVVKLDVRSSLISDLSGLSHFTNLKILYAAENPYVSVDIALPNLEDLYLGGPNLNTINTLSSPNLKFLSIQKYDKTTLALHNNSIKGLVVTGGNNLQNIDLQNCTALKNLTLYSGPAVKSIIGSNMPTLEAVFISNTPDLSHFDFKGSPNFRTISFNTTGLPLLDLTNYSTLENILANGNSFSSVKLDGCTSLKQLNISNNHIPTISMVGTPALETLSLSNNNLTSVPLDNHPNLWNIEMKNNLISNLVLPNLPALKVLSADSNQLTSLDISGAPNLDILTIGYNHLSSLDVSSLINLTELKCEYNSLTQLDLSNNKELSRITCHNNPNLEKIFMKNGKVQPWYYLNLFPNSSLKYICCDEEEFNELSNYTITHGSPNTVINTYCSFTPGGTFYTIQGSTTYDSNNNGCDPNDPGKSFQRFTLTNGSVSGAIISGTSGNYSFPVQAGTHTITPVVENPYFTITPASYTVNFPSQPSPVIKNFCLAANGTHNDLEIMLIPVTDAAPGFDAQYKIVYKNKGTASQSGNIAFNFNNNLMLYKSATIPPSSQSTGAVTWNFTNLLPFETKEITVTVKLNTPTQTPPLNGGDILHYAAQIIGATDETPADNNFELNQTVVNSFDPNHKTCLEGTSISQTQVGDYVHYLIRFENTGTANAKNIVVKDEIDIAKFDISSLIPMNGSHNFVTRITSPNVVEFIFENIQLPFDDANNDGYVSFKIKTKSTLTPGDSFSNTAKIYFDYNAPIITNTYTTTIATTLSTAEVKNRIDSVSIYPNPAKDILYIQSKNDVIKAEIYDSTGRLVISTGVSQKSVSISELPKGNYTIRLFTKDIISHVKFIKE